MEFIDSSQLLKFLSALVFVLSLMGLLALIAKYFSQKAPALTQRKRRLRVVESMMLDAKRKLVIVQCDEKEHLIILGANGETLIESHLESKHDIDHASDEDDQTESKKVAFIKESAS